MHFDKVQQSGVSNNLRHMHRLIQNDKNTDIDLDRTKTSNLCITPYIREVNGEICDVSKMNISPSDVVKPITRENYFTNRLKIEKLEYQHYKDRKDELYCYNRKDVKTLINAVVTLPKELTSQEDIDRFWDCTVSFLSERYGSRNIISAIRHFDESKIGREHIHVSFIPSCKIDKVKLMSKKNHVKDMERYEEKISANDRLSNRDIKTLHSDFQKYIDGTGLKCKVVTKLEGSGKSINLSVEQLKELTKVTGITIDKPITMDEFIAMVTQNRDITIYDSKLKERIESLERENSELKERIKSLENHHIWQKSHEQSSWGNRNNGWSKEKEVERSW